MIAATYRKEQHHAAEQQWRSAPAIGADQPDRQSALSGAGKNSNPAPIAGRSKAVVRRRPILVLRVLIASCSSVSAFDARARSGCRAFGGPDAAMYLCASMPSFCLATDRRPQASTTWRRMGPDPAWSFGATTEKDAVYKLIDHRDGSVLPRLRVPGGARPHF